MPLPLQSCLQILNIILVDCMRGEGGHKSRSLPILRSRIYEKIGIKFQQEKWRQFLNEQLVLDWAIRELSKAQFDVNNHSHQKFSVRQNFITKKEITKCLEKGEITAAQLKLEQLKNKMAMIGQQRGAVMVITYLQCRRMVLEELRTGEEDRVIDYIKERITLYLGDGDLSMMKLKCLNILCILLLRFHGILMTSEERGIIFKTIELKKKKFLYLDLQEQRQSQFQNLLYLLEQLYKLLFLLKKDQQLILNYYNQLYAYTEIFLESHHQKKSNIDVAKLRNTLKDMKPVIIDLNIYEDSKLRKELAVAHIKDQIVQQKQKQFNRRSVDFKNMNSSIRTSFNTKMGSSQKLTSSSKLRLESKHTRKLKLEPEGKEKNSGASMIPEQSRNQLMSQLSTKGIAFQCLFPIKNKFYVIKICLTFRNGFNLIDIAITITKERYSCQIFKLVGVEMSLFSLSFDAINKYIEKMFIRLFGTAQFFELHNLVTVQPKTSGLLQELLSVVVRSKAIVKEYFRKSYYEQPINCAKFVYPCKTAAELKAELSAEAKQTAIRLQKINFAKRKAFINKDEDLPRLQNFIYLKGIIVKRYQQISEYFLFNAYFKQCFKGLDLYSFKDEVQLHQLPLYIKALKQISKAGTLSHKVVTITKSIDTLLSIPTAQERVVVASKQYKLEEELQLNQEKLKYQSLAFRVFSQRKKEEKKSNKQIAQFFEVILTKEREYSLFIKQVTQKYIIYKNQKTKICIPKGLGADFKIVKKRVRMYNSIKAVSNTGAELRSMHSDLKQANSQSKPEQKFVLKFLKHFVLKKKNGYFLALIYLCPENQYLYEIILQNKRYYFFAEECLHRNVLAEVNIQKQTVKEYKLSVLSGRRSKISEANEYYIQTKLTDELRKCVSQKK